MDDFLWFVEVVGEFFHTDFVWGYDAVYMGIWWNVEENSNDSMIMILIPVLTTGFLGVEDKSWLILAIWTVKKKSLIEMQYHPNKRRSFTVWS